jgi:hypothetical protein
LFFIVEITGVVPTPEKGGFMLQEASREGGKRAQFRGVADWENFDALASKLVKNELTFEAFAKATKNEVRVMAKAAVKRRRPRTMTMEDLESRILFHLWYYAFKHVARTGKVGYDPERHNSAGAYLRFSTSHHIQKDIGRDRGENMHTHRMIDEDHTSGMSGRKGRAVKTEVLTATGALEDLKAKVPAEDIELEIEEQNRRARLENLVKATKEFVVQNEIHKIYTSKPLRKRADREVVSFMFERGKKLGFAKAGVEVLYDHLRDAGTLGYGEAKPRKRKAAACESSELGGTGLHHSESEVIVKGQ